MLVFGFVAAVLFALVACCWFLAPRVSSDCRLGVSRADIPENMFAQEARIVHVMPIVTATGYKLITLPQALKDALVAACVDRFQEETPTGYVWSENDSTPTSECVYLYELSHALKEQVDAFVRSEIIKWVPCASDLELTSMYGPREYARGAVLRPHVDRTLTHFLSAVIHISSSGMENPWYLDIWPHTGGHEKIDLSQEADVILYESASMTHARVAPLRGDSYTNLFVHYRTPWWEDAAALKLKLLTD